jgi:GAF domain-containing protein
MPSLPSPEDSAWLVELQSLLLSTTELEDFLNRLATLTVQALPIPTSCGVTLQPNGRALTVAASDSLARSIDEIQYQAGEGPCLESLHTGQVHHISDMSREERWPRFTAHAFAQGVLSSLSVPLIALDGTAGALNLYSTRLDAYDATVRQQAQVFAGYMGGALGIALKLANQAKLSENLRAALASRAVIDQALGIIMAQQRCDAQAAFEILRRASNNRNVKLSAIAAAIVAQISERPPNFEAFPR